ncbi:MAG: NAD(P)H-quinone oxidoreductase [Myxococcales bacterium]|nr:NAD(P)H-quinone oxidoreductase [Myxococcales bacterium]
MRALRITRPGGPEVLQIGEHKLRAPGPGEVHVEVRAAGVNRADILQRLGFYPAPPDAPPDVPGLEFAGIVVGRGEGATRFALGDRVMGITGGGACAEALLAHERTLLPVPALLSDSQAAAVPEAFMTAFDALTLQGEMRMGERVLVQAVGSGVGTAAVQLIRAAGAQALGTSRTADKLVQAVSLGLDVPVHTTDGRFADAVRAATGGEGVDLILDLVSGDYVREGLFALAPRGRLIVVGLLAGPRTDLPLGLLLTKRLTIRGTVLRSRPLEEKIAVARAFARHVLPGLADGTLRPVVHAVLPMAEAAEAHRAMQAEAPFGKLVLTW